MADQDDYTGTGDWTKRSALRALLGAAVAPELLAAASTAAGAYFVGPGDGTGVYATLYRRVEGGAVEVARVPSQAALDELRSLINLPPGVPASFRGSVRAYDAPDSLGLKSGFERLQWAASVAMGKPDAPGSDSHVRTLDMQHPWGGDAAWRFEAPLVLTWGAIDGAQRQSPSRVDGGGALCVPADRFTAAAPLSLMVDARSIYTARLNDLLLDGQGRATTILDTSSYGLTERALPPTGSPSRGNRYTGIQVRGAIGPVIWNADTENDTAFHACFVVGDDSGSQHVRAIALGGPLSFNQCNIYGAYLDLAAQSIDVLSCNITGLRLSGPDRNLLHVSGGQLATRGGGGERGGAIVELAAGASCRGLVIDAAALLMRFDGSVVLGGAGAMYADAAIRQCDVAVVPAERPPKDLAWVSAGVKSGMGRPVLFAIEGGFSALITRTDTPAVLVRARDHSDNLYLRGRRALTGEHVIEESADELYRQYYDRSLAIVTGNDRCWSTPTPIRSGVLVRVATDNFPVSGLLIVRADNSTVPGGLYGFDRATGTVTTLMGGSALMIECAGGALQVAHRASGHSVRLYLWAIGLGL